METSTVDVLILSHDYSHDYTTVWNDYSREYIFLGRYLFSRKLI